MSGGAASSIVSLTARVPGWIANDALPPNVTARPYGYRELRDLYASSFCVVVPLYENDFQAGVTTILEAMAMGVPCVTTELVNGAIGAEGGRQVQLASTPEEFAQRVLELLHDPDLHRRMAAEALEFVRERYSWEAVGEQLDAVLSGR